MFDWPTGAWRLTSNKQTNGQTRQNMTRVVFWKRNPYTAQLWEQGVERMANWSKSSPTVSQINSYISKKNFWCLKNEPRNRIWIQATILIIRCQFYHHREWFTFYNPSFSSMSGIKRNFRRTLPLTSDWRRQPTRQCHTTTLSCG